MSASSFSLKTLVNRQAWPLAEPFRIVVDTGTKDVTSAGLWDLPRRPNPFISTPFVDENLTIASPVFVAGEAAAAPWPLLSANVTSTASDEPLVLVVAEVFAGDEKKPLE